MADVNRSTAAVPYGRGDDEGEAVWFLGQDAGFRILGPPPF